MKNTDEFPVIDFFVTDYLTGSDPVGEEMASARFAAAEKFAINLYEIYANYVVKMGFAKWSDMEAWDHLLPNGKNLWMNIADQIIAAKDELIPKDKIIKIDFTDNNSVGGCYK